MPELRILVLNQLADRHRDVISHVAPNAEIITCDIAQAAQHIATVDILLTWGSSNIRSLYLAAPKLTWVHTLSAGVEQLIFPELQAASTLLTNSRGIHGIPVSEHVLALMLAFSRGLNLLIRQQTAKHWQRVLVSELHEKIIGIVGLGSIGREIAKKAKGLGMHVMATKREMTTELFADKLYSPDKLMEMLPQCDFVVTALPLLEETREMFTLEQFSVMKRSAYFINIARGDIIRQTDLVKALEQNLIQGAGLDVFVEEPLDSTSPLWEMPQVIITPHLAALSPAYLDRAIKLFADLLSRFVEKREMYNVIDKFKGY